jgi:hypothetical protein
MRIQRMCYNGCGRETSFITNTGRKSKVFCAECDEVRIAHITAQLEKMGKELRSATNRGNVSGRPDEGNKG